jgi:hypothetical protein
VLYQTESFTKNPQYPSWVPKEGAVYISVAYPRQIKNHNLIAPCPETGSSSHTHPKMPEKIKSNASKLYAMFQQRVLARTIQR